MFLNIKNLTPKDSTSKIIKREFKNSSNFFTWSGKSFTFGGKRTLYFKIKLWSLQIKADPIPSSEKWSLEVNRPLKEYYGIADPDTLGAQGQEEGSKRAGSKIQWPWRLTLHFSLLPSSSAFAALLAFHSLCRPVCVRFPFFFFLFFAVFCFCLFVVCCFSLLHLTRLLTGHKVAWDYIYFC